MGASGRMVTLESRRLSLVADPACGGRLRSLVSKLSGKQFFYQDRRKAFEMGRGYSYHDISGYDECFPTVAACRGHTAGGGLYDYPDHGVLWQGTWHSRLREDTLVTTCEVADLGCSFTRHCSFQQDNVLLLEYHIVNDGDSCVPCLYSAHPLLVADESTKAILPEGMVRAYSYLSARNSGLADGQWLELSSSDVSTITGPFSPSRHTFAKLFSDRLEEGQAAVEYHDRGERLELAFDTAALPYLGLLVQQGYDSLGDGHFGGECLLAFEPTTGIGDDIPTCIRTNTQVVLPAGSDWSFWIRISVERL